MPWTLCQLGKAVGHAPNYNWSWHHWLVARDFSWFVFYCFLISRALPFFLPASSYKSIVFSYFHNDICWQQESEPTWEEWMLSDAPAWTPDAWGRRADKGRCCPNRTKTVSCNLSHKADAVKVFIIQGPQNHQFVHYISCSTSKLTFKKKKAAN